MKGVGFDGREGNLPLYGKSKRGEKSKSNLHKRARKLIRGIFPRERILEEVALPGSNKTKKRSTLYADFFIPRQDLVIEVHGRQHYEYVKFYHKDKKGYYRSRARDRQKIEWCDLNKIDIVSLKYSDSDDDWKQAILNR